MIRHLLVFLINLPCRRPGIFFPPQRIRTGGTTDDTDITDSQDSSSVSVMWFLLLLLWLRPSRAALRNIRVSSACFQSQQRAFCKQGGAEGENPVTGVKAVIVQGREVFRCADTDLGYGSRDQLLIIGKIFSPH